MFKNLYSLIVIGFISILLTSCAEQNVTINIGDTSSIIESATVEELVSSVSDQTYTEHAQIQPNDTLPVPTLILIHATVTLILLLILFLIERYR